MIDYNNTDRIEMLADLTYDQKTKCVDETKFDKMLTDHYDDFVTTCEKVEEDAESIKSVTCCMEGEELKFNITKK